jgi:hypothetical protein
MNKFLLVLLLCFPIIASAQIATEANIPFTLDSDNDGSANILDTDDDNDGVLDIMDAFPLDPTKTVPTSATAVATVIADATCRNNGSNGGKNYGAEVTSELNNNQRYQILKFTKPAITGIISATLNVQTSTQTNPLEISSQTDNSWFEGTLNGFASNGTTQGVTFTGNNTNYLAKTLLGTTTAPSAGKYTFALPLTSIPSSGNFSLIVQDLTNTGIKLIYTKETAGKAATIDFNYLTPVAPRLIVTPISNDTTYLAGAPFTVGFALTQAPTDTVYVPLTIFENSKATIVGDQVLMFTPSNWNVMQTKTITPAAPGVMDIIIKPIHSDDAFYNGFNTEDLKNYFIQANDITNLSGWTVATGSTFTYPLNTNSATGSVANKFKLLQAPIGMGITENNGTINFHPLSTQVGTWPVTIQVTADKGNISYFKTEITVTNGGVADPAGIYVVPNGAQGGNGTAALPYNNIATAVTAANASSVGNVYVRGGEYDMTSTTVISTAATAANPIVIQPFPGENVKFNFNTFSCFNFDANSAYITFQGFEIDGGTDAVDFWCLVSNAFWGDQSITRGGGLALIVDGKFLTMQGNYIHNCYQKGIEIGAVMGFKAYDNIIQSIATTSLSGGHGIMRQQSSGEIFVNDTVNYRWDLMNNFVFNVEQRIYSWVPSKGFIDMVLDEGKPILIDDPKDTDGIQELMKAKIENNVVAFGAIDQIRLKSTPNLTCKNNTVYSASPLADGITDKVGDTPTPKFTGAKIQNNVVQTMPGTTAFDLVDITNQGNSTVPAVISGNYAAVGNILPSGAATVATPPLFLNPDDGNFRLNPALGLPATLGVPAAILDSIDARATKFAVNIKWDRWVNDHLKLSQTILDNIPGVNDGIVGNETVFTNTGVLHLNPLPALSEIDFNVIPGTAWKAATGAPAVEHFELNPIYAAWYKARNAATKNSAGTDYTRIRWGNSFTKQDQVFQPDWLTNSQITAPDSNTVIFSDNADFTLDGDLLVDFEGYTPMPGDSWLLMKAATITSANTAPKLFDSVKFEGATLLPNQYTLSIINTPNGQALELKIISQVPAMPVATLVQPSCSTNTGTITITSPLGTGLTYSIDNATYTNTTGIFTNVAPGTYSITAKNATGGISTPSIVTINPAPVVPTTPITTLIQPTCTTTTGVATITSPIGAGFTYSKDGTIFTNTNGVFTSLASGTYTLTVKSAQGCSATTTVTIAAAPSTPAAPIASVTQPTCSTNTGSISITPTPGFSYSMDGTNYSNTTGVFTNVASGTYSLTAQNASGCISPQAVVIINAAPVIPAAPSVSPMAATICDGTATSLNASGCSGTVTWYNNSAPTVAIGTGSSISIMPSTNTSYFATCTNASSGCTSLPSSLASITVVTPPSGPNISVDNNTVCVGTTINLSGLSCNTPDVLTWLKDGNAFGTGLSFTDVPAVGTHTYTAICNTTGAVSCASAASNLVVTINALPTAPSINTSTATICQGASTTLTASGAMLGESYVWSDGQTGSSITVSPITNTSYTVKIINTTTNCESTNSLPIAIMVTPIPTSAPIASVMPTAICAGDSATLTATCSLGNAVWYTDNTFTTSTSTTVTPTSTTTYYVRCENMGCNGPAANAIVTVNTKPSKPVATILQPACPMMTGVITITAPVLANITYSNDGTAYTNIDGIFNNLIPNTYTLTAQTVEGCISDTAMLQVLQTTCPDTVMLTPNCPTCVVSACVLGDEIAGGIAGGTFSICGAPNGYSAAVPDANGCVTFTPIAALDTVPDYTCIVVCKNGICDTTVVKIEAPLLSISGTVFNDVNGSTDNTLNGTGTNAGGLNAYAIDANGNAIAYGAVQANGSYTITEVKRGLVKVLLSDAPPPPTQIGVPVQVAVNLPTGWVPTAEQIAGVLGDDGNANAISSAILLRASDTVGVNFAVEQAPVGQDTSLTPIANPGPGNSVVLDPNIFKGRDAGTNTIDSIYIANYPTDADSVTIGSITYTSATWPNTGLSIATTNTGSPLLPIALYPNAIATEAEISFVFVDEANVKSLNSIKVKIPITPTPPFFITDVQLIGLQTALSNELNWEITNRNNAAKSILYRSYNGADGFNKIFETNGISKFTDLDILSKSLFYVIEVIYNNGLTSRSNIVAIKRDQDISLNIFPNPAKDFLTINWSNINVKKVEIVVYDVNGKTVLADYVLDKKETKLNVKSLAKGEYLLSIIINGKKNIHKFIKD